MTKLEAERTLFDLEIYIAKYVTNRTSDQAYLEREYKLLKFIDDAFEKFDELEQLKNKLKELSK